MTEHAKTHVDIEAETSKGGPEEVLVTATLPSSAQADRAIDELSKVGVSPERHAVGVRGPTEQHPSGRAVMFGTGFGALVGAAVGVGSAEAMRFAGTPSDDLLAEGHGGTLVLFAIVGAGALAVFGALVGLAFDSRRSGPVVLEARTDPSRLDAVREVLAGAHGRRIETH